MTKRRYTPEEKKQHVDNWRAGGLTRKQYCKLHDLRFMTFRDWPQEMTKTENPSTLIPVRLAPANSHQTPVSLVSEPIVLFLPGGLHLTCQTTQLTDVLRAFKHVDA